MINNVQELLSFIIVMCTTVLKIQDRITHLFLCSDNKTLITKTTFNVINF